MARRAPRPASRKLPSKTENQGEVSHDAKKSGARIQVRVGKEKAPARGPMLADQCELAVEAALRDQLLYVVY